VNCDWSVVEYGDKKEIVVEVMEDIPALPRKRCSTMPGSFVVPDDMSQDDCHINDG